jgi:hypothetical protein
MMHGFGQRQYGSVIRIRSDAVEFSHVSVRFLQFVSLRENGVVGLAGSLERMPESRYQAPYDKMRDMQGYLVIILPGL